jgi:predicted O-linked N-acetylglucosamine transferase (SPINDLY family)
LLYIPGTTFRPPADCPPVTPPPALDAGVITFASFNRLGKVSDECFRTWGEILARTPGSRLVMVASAREVETIREKVHAHFEAIGVDPTRLDLRSRLPLSEFMALLGTVDIALDPFPYSGGTTSLLTLWMGVPFVALAGTDGASRGGQETLGAVRTPDLVGKTPADYVKIAVALAEDLERLTMLRSELRARLMLSPGMQEGHAVRHLATVLRQAWREHVQTVQHQDASALQPL